MLYQEGGGNGIMVCLQTSWRAYIWDFTVLGVKLIQSKARGNDFLV